MNLAEQVRAEMHGETGPIPWGLQNDVREILFSMASNGICRILGRHIAAWEKYFAVDGLHTKLGNWLNIEGFTVTSIPSSTPTVPAGLRVGW